MKEVRMFINFKVQSPAFRESSYCGVIYYTPVINDFLKIFSIISSKFECYYFINVPTLHPDYRRVEIPTMV